MEGRLDRHGFKQQVLVIEASVQVSNLLLSSHISMPRYPGHQLQSDGCHDNRGNLDVDTCAVQRPACEDVCLCPCRARW